MTDKTKSCEPGTESGGNANEPGIRLMIAGAGTGGHLFPGIAVAQKITGRLPDARTLFVTTGRPIETRVLARHAFETASIPAAGIKGKSIRDKFGSLFILPRGFLASIGLLRGFRPHVVMGMGGYSSGPVILAARIFGIPTVIHEQNRLPGMTNRILARFTDRVYVSFSDTLFSGKEKKIRFTGNPVRSEILDCRAGRGEVKPHGEKEPLTVLILGGSQGAHSINMALVDSVDHLGDPAMFRFIDQTGGADEERVRAAYDSKGIQAEVSAFFDDMAGLYLQADLAICRSGASTVAELAAACVPAVFIPYPHAADNHQEANARGMESAGAARILLEKEMDGAGLAGLLSYFESDRAELIRMENSIGSTIGKTDSAGAIADDMLDLAGFGNTVKNEAES